jgi:site-specific recombinase XerD
VSELIDQLHCALRARHYSRRTEQNYCLWVRRYIRLHGLRHPADMAEPEINAFVTHLAVAGHVSASTQTQALSALLFLYRHVLHREVGELRELVRARTPRRLPVVLSRDEVRAVLHELDVADRQSWLIASLLYGAGLRLVKRDLDNWQPMKGQASRRVFQLIRELLDEGLL